jgi:hypothetical protein
MDILHGDAEIGQYYGMHELEEILDILDDDDSAIGRNKECYDAIVAWKDYVMWKSPTMILFETIGFSNNCLPELAADVVDAMVNRRLLPGVDELDYVQFRSMGRREMVHNTSFWAGADAVRMRRPGLTTKEMYDRNPVLEEKIDLIDRLVNARSPVCVCLLGHSRTIVSMTESHYLFSDNWGINKCTSDKVKNGPTVKHADGTTEPANWVQGGYAQVHKIVVGTHAKDALWVRNPSVSVPYDPFGNAKKTTNDSVKNPPLDKIVLDGLQALHRLGRGGKRKVK